MYSKNQFYKGVLGFFCLDSTEKGFLDLVMSGGGLSLPSSTLRCPKRVALRIEGIPKLKLVYVGGYMLLIYLEKLKS